MFFVIFQVLRIFFQKYPKTVIGLIVANALYSGLLLVEPLFFREITDALIASFPQNDIFSTLLPVLFLWGGVSLTILILKTAVSYITDVMCHREYRTEFLEFVTHTLSLSFRFFGDTHSGKILKKLSRGTDAFFEVGLSFFRRVLPHFFFLLFLLPTVLFLHFWMGLFVSLAIPFFFGVAAWAISKTNTLQQEIEELYSKTSGLAGDAFANISVVKSFVQEDAQKSIIQKLLDTSMRKQLPVLKWWTFLIVLSRLATTVLLLGTFFLGVWFFSQGMMTVGEIVMFLGFATILFATAEDLLWAISEWFWKMASLEEFFEILHTPLEVQDVPNAKLLPSVRGAVSFSAVTFSHDGQKDALKKVSFDVAPGKSVALVGHTGAGKSTVANLLCRFFEPQKGTIAIDGVDISTVTQSSLRQNIGVVFQENSLFHASILENVRVGNPNALENDVESALKKAHIWDLVDGLPKKMDTIVGERGVKLSGGERQRIAIARAFLKDAPILLLDEATSALDAITEKYLQEALSDLMKGRTTFIIAHRLSTIRKADEILVFEEGKIVERGTFHDLLEQKGVFANLVAAQQEGIIL